LNFNKAYLKQEIVTAVETISQKLLETFPMLDFTIDRYRDESNAIWFVIHDRNVFMTIEFQEYITLNLMRDYLWPKKIFNILFIFQEKETV